MLVAVSGGIDSVTLLHILLSLKQKQGWSLALGHINHGMRGVESDGDETFVRDLAKRYELPIHVHRIDPATWKDPGNTQAKARAIRYQVLENWLKEENYDLIATAHNADDQAETLLDRLTRGSGVDGLSGIPWINGLVVRPLLDISRQQIQRYGQRHELAWREDASNQSLKYFRNALRHGPLRDMTRLRPTSVRQMAAAAERLRETSEAMAWLLKQDLSKRLNKQNNQQFSLDVSDWNQAPIGLRLALLRAAMKQVTANGLWGFGDVHWRDLDRAALTPHRFSERRFPQGIAVLGGRNRLIISQNQPPTPEAYTHSLDIPGEVDTPLGRIQATLLDTSTGIRYESPNTAYFDASAIDLPLQVRSRCRGDRIQLPNLGQRSVARVMSDLKTPRYSRSHLPLLLSRKSRVLWIVGLRRSSHALVGAETRSILGIKFIPNDSNILEL